MHHRHRPATDSTARSARPALVALALLAACAAAAGCDSGKSKDDAPAADAAAEPRRVPLEPERGAAQFVELRLQALVDLRLPAAIAAKDLAEAHRLCEIGGRRLRESEALVAQAPAIVPLGERIELLCAREVAILLLDELLRRIRNASEDKLATTCQAGTPTMAFLYDHRSDDPTVAERRGQIFELCPSLEQEWEAVDKAVRDRWGRDDDDDGEAQPPEPREAPPGPGPTEPPEPGEAPPGDDPATPPQPQQPPPPTQE